MAATKWEVFDTTDGTPLFTTRDQSLAEKLVDTFKDSILRIDCAPEGKGWIDGTNPFSEEW